MQCLRIKKFKVFSFFLLQKDDGSEIIITDPDLDQTCHVITDPDLVKSFGSKRIKTRNICLRTAVGDIFHNFCVHFSLYYSNCLQGRPARQDELSSERVIFGAKAGA